MGSAPSISGSLDERCVVWSIQADSVGEALYGAASTRRGPLRSRDRSLRVSLASSARWTNRFASPHSGFFDGQKSYINKVALTTSADKQSFFWASAAGDGKLSLSEMFLMRFHSSTQLHTKRTKMLDDHSDVSWERPSCRVRLIFSCACSASVVESFSSCA
jgi:hypothetical protein